jgi:O-antigen/teichoic acid export membrane protein
MSQNNGGGARRDVAAGAATLLSTRATVAAMAVVFIAISTRILTLREMAVFAIYNSLCALQAVLCSLGLLTTCTRDLPALMGKEDHDGAARLLRTAMATNAFVSALVASVLAWAARPLSLYFFQHDGFAPTMRWVALAVFLWNLFEANQIFLVSLQRFKAYGRANITCAAAQRITSLSLFLLLSPWGYGLLGYMGGFAVGTLVGLRSNFGALKDLASRPAGFAPLRPLLRYSAPFYADGYLRYLYMQADQLLVALFLSPEVLSLYFVARRFAQYYQQTVASTIDPVLAKVSEIRTRGREAVERSLRSASRYFGLVFLPLAAGTAAMSALFLDVAGGARYREAVLVLAILSGSVALYALFNLVTGYVYMVGAPADRLRHNLVTGISQIVLVAGLLGVGSRLGISPLMGAALIALARAGALLVGLIFAHGQLRRYIRPVYDIRALPRSLVASLVLLAAAGAPQLYLYHPALVPLYGLVGTALFVLVIRPAVRPEDLDLLSGVFGDRARGLQRIIRRILGHPTAPTA